MRNDTTTTKTPPWGLHQRGWGAVTDPTLAPDAAARLQHLLWRRMQARPTSPLAMTAGVCAGALVLIALTVESAAPAAGRVLLAVVIVLSVTLPVGLFTRARGLSEFQGRYLLGTTETADEVVVSARLLEHAEGTPGTDVHAAWAQEWRRLSGIYEVSQ